MGVSKFPRTGQRLVSSFVSSTTHDLPFLSFYPLRLRLSKKAHSFTLLPFHVLVLTHLWRQDCHDRLPDLHFPRMQF